MKFEGEKQAQKHIQLGKNQTLTGERHLRNGVDDKTDTPVLSIKNLSDFVTNLLDTYEKNGRLTWHD